MVADAGKPWVTYDWDTTIEVLEGAAFNLDKMLEGKRIG